jgi:hypothetical protein
MLLVMDNRSAVASSAAMLPRNPPARESLLGSGRGWLIVRLAVDAVRGRLGMEVARLLSCGWLAEGTGRITVVSAATVVGAESGADEAG